MLIVDFKPGTRSLESPAEAGAASWAARVGVRSALATEIFGASPVRGSTRTSFALRPARGWPEEDSYSIFQRRVGSDQSDGRARF